MFFFFFYVSVVLTDRVLKRRLNRTIDEYPRALKQAVAETEQIVGLEIINNNDDEKKNYEKVSR